MYDINQMVKLKHFIENKIYLVIGIKYLLFSGFAYYLAFNIHIYPIYDELAYLDHVKTIGLSDNFWYLGDRNRMPLFNYLLFLFYDSSLDGQSIYERLQLANIILTISINFAFFYLLKRYFSSTLLALITNTFILFLPLSAFVGEVIVESTYYAFFCIYLLVFFNIKESNKPSDFIKFGFAGAILYLFKATGLLIFLISVVYLLYRMPNKNNIKNILYSLSAFFITTAPYLIENYIKFRKNIFYNVNTTFYVWYDSWEQVENGTKKYGDRVGWPNIDESLIPSASKYLQSHTLTEVLERFYFGLESFLQHYLILGSNGFIFFLSIIMISLLNYFIFKNRKLINRKSIEFELKYTFILLSILLPTSFWYSYIANSVRFTILLFIPVYILLFKSIDIKVENLDASTSNIIEIKIVFISIFIFLAISLVGLFFIF